MALKKADYFEVQPFAGAQDLGRDVVGFLTPARHEGDWHNYQCKQYTRQRLPLGEGLKELGKVLYRVSSGAFTPPTKYFFVAPFGISRPLEQLIDKPSMLRAKLLGDWEKHCARKIVKGQVIALGSALQAVIEAFDFSNVVRISLEEMLSAERVRLVLHQHFGADPGPAPAGMVPVDVQPSELPYVGELVAAYGERDGVAYKGHGEVGGNGSHSRHFRAQRERFFDADSFKRFYRDNTEPETLPRLERDVEHGISDVHAGLFADTLGRVDGVMAQAATIRPGGPLADHAGITVKQGLCQVDDGHGKDDPLNVVIEIKGFRGLDAQLKAETMSAMWVPAVNALETSGRWAFGEFRDVYEIEKAFAKLVDEAISTTASEMKAGA